MTTYKNPALTVDAIILYPNEEIVFIKRKNMPFQGMWALPGGFVDYGTETVEEACIREAEEETSLKVKIIKLIGVYSKPDRDPRGHTVSVVFLVEAIGGELKAADDAKEVARLSNWQELELAFDHKQILEDAFL